jgi:hypothetical protein
VKLITRIRLLPTFKVSGAVYLHSHYIPSWRWQGRFNFHLFNCTARSEVYMAVLWWVAGLLQVQLEVCYGEWLGYCRFSLRFVMVSGGITAGLAWGLLWWVAGLLQVHLRFVMVTGWVTAGSAWGLLWWVAGLLQVQLEVCYGERLGYCRFNLRLVMLSGWVNACWAWGLLCWVAGLLLVQLKACYGEWMDYCRFSLRFVMVSSWVTTGSA